MLQNDTVPGFSTSFPIIEAKILPVAMRDGSVPRTRLVRMLTDGSAPPIVSVIGPPGYGKTTLLAQWAAVESRPMAWLTIDHFDNDLPVLMAYLMAAFDRVRPIDAGLAGSLTGSAQRIAATAVPRLASELHRWPEPAVLVLDDAHRLVDRECLDALAQLIEHLPRGFRVAVAGRSEPGLPFARLRAQGNLQEIGTGLLALNDAETRSLTAAAGWDLSETEAHDLAMGTEGWPAAVYLAALAASGGDRDSGSPATVTGGDRYISAYLRSELGRVMSADDVRFLMLTAVLERVEPEVAEALTGMPHAGARLERLARTNLLIQPVGSSRATYRYHNLLRDYLMVELDRLEPSGGGDAHRAAAEWFAAAGDPRAAIEHANEAGDPDLAARVVLAAAVPAWQSGHASAVAGWISAVDSVVIGRNPALAGVATWVEALAGKPDVALRMASIVERASFEGPPGDGTASHASQRALIRALTCPDGPREMLANAQVAASLEPVGSRWRGQALMLVGGAHVLLGAPDDAEAAFEQSLEADWAAGAPPGVSLGMLAGVALSRSDPAAAARWARHSGITFAPTRVEGFLTALLLHAVVARVAIQEGDLPTAREALVRAQLVRPLANHAIPWFSVYALLHLARAYLAIAEPAGAQLVLREAEQIVRRRPALGVLTDELLDLRRRLASAASAIGGSTTLTAAELRILPLLPTYLSFQDIADRLMISRNTVKTHAMSIYGKLWASSRGEAVERAVELGLLEPYPGLEAIAPGGEGPARA